LTGSGSSLLKLEISREVSKETCRFFIIFVNCNFSLSFSGLKKTKSTSGFGIYNTIRRKAGGGGGGGFMGFTMEVVIL
jgi:hypothetical protein